MTQCQFQFVVSGDFESEYGLKPKGDYDFQNLLFLPVNDGRSEYGLKPKGDYDGGGDIGGIGGGTGVRIWTQAERRL